jgi:hypothetical protein
MGAHWPICSGRLQATQAPAQLTLQQTPSVQKPEAHCSAVWQTMPSGRKALQPLPEQQIPPAQVPVSHWMSQAQASPEALRAAGGTEGQRDGSTPSTKLVLRSAAGTAGS